jgi:hypothetical protein
MIASTSAMFAVKKLFIIKSNLMISED